MDKSMTKRKIRTTERYTLILERRTETIADEVLFVVVLIHLLTQPNSQYPEEENMKHIPYLLLHFTAFQATCSAPVRLLSNGDDDLHDPDNNPRYDGPMSFDEFSSVLFSDLTHVHEDQNLSAAEKDELWKKAVDAQLKLHEANNETDRRGLQEAPDYFPFLVCDNNFGKTGEDCHKTVASYFGHELMPVYNQDDKSCYITGAPANMARSMPPGLTAAPLLPQAKIEAGAVEAIDDGQEFPEAIDIMFCPSWTENKETAEALAQGLLDRSDVAEAFGNRRLAQNMFLATYIGQGPPDHAEVLARKMQESMEDETCSLLHSSLEMEGSDNGDGVVMSLGSETEDTMATRDCLTSLISELSTRPEVCSIGVQFQVKTLNREAQWVTQSGSPDSLPFFDVGLTGRDQVIAVSDTGIDLDNCYFWDSTSDPLVQDGSVDPGQRKVIQYVASADSTDARRGHGTHVTASAVGRRATGGATESTGEADGMARDAKVAFIDVGFGNQDALRIPRTSSLLNPGRDAGARIHSASWGTESNSYSFRERDYDEYMFVNDDFLFVVAAGNSGDRNRLGTVGRPAVSKNCLSVGATQNASPHITRSQLGIDYLASFSSRGPTRDQRMKPDVVAPGFWVQSAEARPDQVGECDDTGRDGLMFLSGTSMAAPIVSGTASLVRQYFEEGWYPRGEPGGETMNASSALVKAVLINSGRELRGIQNRDGSVTDSEQYDNHQAFGRITLLDALPLEGHNSLNARVVDRGIISNGQEEELSVTIDESGGCNGPLSASLVWTDPPAFPGCSACVLNDLDLSIVGDGRTFFPNGRTGVDTLNNAERVRIANPTVGSSYSVRVVGRNLESQTQAYALIVTGCFGDDDQVGQPAPPNEQSPTESPNQSPTQAPTESGNEPVDDPECEDDPDATVYIDGDSDSQSCEWLADRNSEYDFLCGFVDVATSCAKTCGFCGNNGSGDAGSITILPDTGDTRYFGIMFDVVAKADITVKSMNVHNRINGRRGIRIYTKSGSFEGSQFSEEGWDRIVDGAIQSPGFGQTLRIPEEMFLRSISIPEGSTQSFYITVGGRDLIMTETDQIGSSIAENDEVEIQSGIAIAFPFGGQRNSAFPSYHVNGRLHYTSDGVARSGDCSDSSGTVLMDEILGEKECSWLAGNMNRFGYLCNFVDVAAQCQATCDSCGQSSISVHL